MITLRPAHTRGHANHGWLDTWHSFSFADYYDPEEMGYGTLRVINEDRVAPGGGFPTHGHRDMEIVTYILEGALEHKDSLGNGSVITPGQLQRMSAGRGILHSEYNPSADTPVHLLQIWIEPASRGLAPGYEQKRFDPAELHGRLRLVASPLGRAGSVTIHQDTEIYAARLGAGEAVSHVLKPGRLAYLHVARGRLALNGLAMAAGDGAKVHDELRLDIVGLDATELLLFDMIPDCPLDRPVPSMRSSRRRTTTRPDTICLPTRASLAPQAAILRATARPGVQPGLCPSRATCLAHGLRAFPRPQGQSGMMQH